MRNRPPAWLRWPALFGLSVLLVLLIPTIWLLSRAAGPLIEIAEWAKDEFEELAR